MDFTVSFRKSTFRWSGDDFLPVPLVYKNRMQIVRIIIPADGIHVRVNALSRTVAVTIERHALPLGKGLHDFSLSAVNFLDRKIDLALHAVEVVIDAVALFHDERCGHSVQCQRKGQCLLKQILDILDCVLRFTQGEGRSVALRDIQ